MKQKDIEKISEPLRKAKVTHLFLAKTKGCISLSSIATFEDMYDFFEVMAESSPSVLEVMQAVLDSKSNQKIKKTQEPLIPN